MAPAITIWLTDRSRYSLGTSRCGRNRYLTNHFGPTGYGIVRKAESLPLATGHYAHVALETLYQHLVATDTFPTPEVVRAAVNAACSAYEKRIEQRGYRGILASEKAESVVAEQMNLITGLVWGACRTVLPWLHREFRIIQTEIESIYVLDCTCGLGSEELDVTKHDAKGCFGVGQMIRQDCLAEPRTRPGLAYIEAKTTGWAGDAWASQWETKPQLPIGTFGVRERFGKDVTETYIFGMYKGSRKEYDGQIRQDSPFCYGYCRPGNPPLASDDWVPSYEWTDESTGEVKRKSRAHVKRGVGDLAETDWEAWTLAKAADPSLLPAEFWACRLPLNVVQKQVFLVGPMIPSQVQVASLKRQIVGEERKWQDVLWQLHDFQEQTGHGWASDEFQAKLDALVPASWDCRRYGAKHTCEHLGTCLKHPGWEDPLAGGLFVPRRPHHAPELAQAMARGLLPEIAEEDEGDEE